MGKNSKKKNKTENKKVEQAIEETEAEQIVEDGKLSREEESEFPINCKDDFYDFYDDDDKPTLRSWKQKDFGNTREKKILFCDYMILRWEAKKLKLQTIPTKEEKKKTKLQKKIDKMKKKLADELEALAAL